MLLGITAMVAFSVGRQNVPSSSAPVAAIVSPPMVMAQVMVPPPNSSSGPSPTPPDNKRNAEAALTAAAIAAIIIQASRDQYHATGRPCACPDDLMRNGRACGGNSAYSRPGGTEPLCYPTDVTATMIEQYRQKMAPH